MKVKIKQILNNNRYICPTTFCPCSSRRCHDDQLDIEIRDDNCCFCYFDGLLRQLPSVPSSLKNLNKKRHIDIIYASFHSDVSDLN